METLSEVPTIRYQPLVFRYSNVPLGNNLMVQIKPNGVPIKFSLGPDAENISGVGVQSNLNRLPLGNLYVNSNTIRLQTPLPKADDADSQQLFSFELTVWIAAAPTIETFFLTGFANPDVHTTVQVGNAMPQVLGNATTLFSWYPLA